MSLPRLHLVTNDAVLADERFLDQAAALMLAVGAGAAMHLRGHATPPRTLEAFGERLAALALQSGAWLFINDRVDIARAVRAQGVQLGVRSIPIADARMQLGRGAWIGYSAHGADEAGRAAADGADFVVVGTIFESASHVGSAVAGVERIEQCVDAAGVPVIAIGGMTPARVGAVAAAGAYGVAVLSGVWRASAAQEAAAEYIAALAASYGAAPLEEKRT